jgi:hypothetical protein
VPVFAGIALRADRIALEGRLSDQERELQPI